MDDIKLELINVNTDLQNDASNEQQIQVRFQPAKSARYLPSTPTTNFSVPIKLGRAGLSELVNHILNLTPVRPLEFLISNKFLRVTLEKYLQSHNLGLEDELEIEYLEATPPPDRDQSTPHPDWVSSIDSCLGVIPAMLPTEFKSKKVKQQGTEQQYDEQDSLLSVVGCYDHLVRVWAHSMEIQEEKKDLFDAQSQEKFQKSTHSLVAQGAGHVGPVTAVRVVRPFTKQTNLTSALLLSGSHDKTARLWELQKPSITESTKVTPKAQKLQCLGIFDYHVGSVTAVETLFHPNRPNSMSDTRLGGAVTKGVVRFLTAGYDGAIALWSNQPDYRISQDEVEENYSLMNKGMGRKLKQQRTHALQTSAKVSSIDEELTLPHYKPITAYMGHRGAVTSLIWPAERHFYSAGYDSTIKYWDMERSKYIHSWSGGHVVNCLDYSHTLNLLASGDQDGFVRLWDPRLPNGNALDDVDSDDEESVTKQRAPTTKTNKGQFKACDSWVSSVKFAHNITNAPYYMTTTGYDGKSKLWDIRSSKPLHIMETNSERLLCGDFVPGVAPQDGTNHIPVFSVCGGTGKQVDRLHWYLNINE